MRGGGVGMGYSPLGGDVPCDFHVVSMKVHRLGQNEVRVVWGFRV